MARKSAWTPEKDACLARMWAAGVTRVEIGRALCCSDTAVAKRAINTLGLPSRRASLRGAPDTASPPADGREVSIRALAPLPRSTTALLLGDPLPGRSALDRRRAQGAAR